MARAAGREGQARARVAVLSVLMSVAMLLPAREEKLPAVDLALVLCVDVSSSMSDAELRLQRDGYVHALTDPGVLQAIGSGRLGRIALAYVEWAGPDHQRVLLPWTVLEERADAEDFAAALAGRPIAGGRGTSISAALYAAAALLAVAPAADRHTVDVSGDGPNNAGPSLQPIHDALTAQGVTINGLAIARRSAEIADGFGPGYVGLYYESCVIGGSGAFLLTVNDPAGFAAAIRRKLATEIAGLPARAWPASAGDRSRPAVDCLSVGPTAGR